MRILSIVLCSFPSSTHSPPSVSPPPDASSEGREKGRRALSVVTKYETKTDAFENISQSSRGRRSDQLNVRPPAVLTRATRGRGA